MKIKQITTLLVLSLTLFLTACQDSVSNDDETIYGTFSVSEAEKTFADNNIREVVEFSENIYGDATFKGGYSVLNKSTTGVLYLGVYNQKNTSPNISTKERAKLLQNSNKKSWTVQTDKSDEGGATVYEASDAFSEVNQQSPTVAVKVKYDETDKAYWIYLAIPEEMMEASDSEKIKRMFLERRNFK